MNDKQKYPYFTVTRVDSGQLLKLTNKKFVTYFDALKFIDKKYKNREETFNSEQIVILEYKSQYKSIIFSIYNFGDLKFFNKKSFKNNE